MKTTHKLIIGDCTRMQEIGENSIHLIITSPPYFNAPFDYKGLFGSYAEFLEMIEKFAKESYRVLQNGRIAVINIDDMLVDGEKFPIVADTIKLFQKAGFRYRDRLIWKKPDGYTRISRRSGVLLQNPYPMYYYPDNILESILIFQKGRFEYGSISQDVRRESQLNTQEFLDNKWYMTLWQITNVLPNSILEKGIAAFPDELPYRFIKLYSYLNEIILDPFVGSGTTMKMARALGRNSIGFDVKEDLIPIIKKKTGFENQTILSDETDKFEVIVRQSG